MGEPTEEFGERYEGLCPVAESELAGRHGGTAGSGSRESRGSSSAMDIATTYVAPRTCTVVDLNQGQGDMRR